MLARHLGAPGLQRGEARQAGVVQRQRRRLVLARRGAAALRLPACARAAARRSARAAAAAPRRAAPRARSASAPACCTRPRLRRWPSAISWRSTPRHCASLTSAPMPKVRQRARGRTAPPCRSPCRAARRSGGRRRSAGRRAGGSGRCSSAPCARPRSRPRWPAGAGSCRSSPQGRARPRRSRPSSRTRRQSCASASASSASSLPRWHALELLAGRALVDHAALVHHVGQAVGHPGVGGQAVAAGAAGLLVVALDVLRQVEVGDEAHVGLVDAHAEGDGRHHHDAVLAQEAVLVALAHVGVEPGVVGQRGDAFVVQPGGGLLDLLARSGSRRCRRRPRARRG